jgi:hypothetical protein
VTTPAVEDYRAARDGLDAAAVDALADQIHDLQCPAGSEPRHREVDRGRARFLLMGAAVAGWHLHRALPPPPGDVDRRPLPQQVAELLSAPGGPDTAQQAAAAVCALIADNLGHTLHTLAQEQSAHYRHRPDVSWRREHALRARTFAAAAAAVHAQLHGVAHDDG